jgi:hypothetical protein
MCTNKNKIYKKNMILQTLERMGTNLHQHVSVCEFVAQEHCAVFSGCICLQFKKAPQTENKIPIHPIREKKKSTQQNDRTGVFANHKKVTKPAYILEHFKKSSEVRGSGIVVSQLAFHNSDGSNAIHQHHIGRLLV